MDQWFTLQQINGRQSQASVTRDPYKCQTPGDLKYGSDFQVLPLISACAAKEQTLFIYRHNSLYKRKPSQFWKYVGVGHLQDILNFAI